MEQGIRPIGEQFTDPSFLMSQTTKSGKNEQPEIMKNQWRNFIVAFFQSAVGTLQTLVVALGAGLGIWGAINLMEGYGNDNPGANAHVR